MPTVDTGFGATTGATGFGAATSLGCTTGVATTFWAAAMAGAVTFGTGASNSARSRAVVGVLLATGGFNEVSGLR